MGLRMLRRGGLFMVCDDRASEVSLHMFEGCVHCRRGLVACASRVYFGCARVCDHSPSQHKTILHIFFVPAYAAQASYQTEAWPRKPYSLSPRL